MNAESPKVKRKGRPIKLAKGKLGRHVRVFLCANEIRRYNALLEAGVYGEFHNEIHLATPICMELREAYHRAVSEGKIIPLPAPSPDAATNTTQGAATQPIE